MKNQKLFIQGFCELLAGAAGQRFKILAYTGGKLRVNGFDLPVVVDLRGLNAGADVPILLGHDPSDEATLGQTDSIENDYRQLMLAGPITGDSPRVQRALEAANERKHKWQASIGCLIEETVEIPTGETVEVNGQLQAGPFYLATRSELRETSVLGRGADAKTWVNLAAAAALDGAFAMPTFEEWVQTNLKTDPGSLSPEMKQALMQQYEAQGSVDDGEGLAAAGGAKPPGDSAGGDAGAGGAACPPKTKEGDGAMGAQGKLDLEAARKEWANENRRISGINKVCGDQRELAARAVEEGWSVDKTELAFLKASSAGRFGAPAGHIRQVDRSPQVLEAALCTAVGLKIEKHFDGKTLEAADKQYKGGIGLQQVLLEAAAQHGYVGPMGPIRSQAVLREVLQAAFTSTSLPGILSNTANKSLLKGYDNVEKAWAEISAIGNFNDFKVHTRYRLVDGGTMEKVGADGKLKHGKLSEQSFTNQAETYGRLYAITRKMLMNDDLDALGDIPRRIGRQSALTLNKVFWTEFLDNAAFFTSGNKNYYANSAAALSSASLSVMVALFANQVDPEGFPVSIEPKILLVGPTNKTTADELYVGRNLAGTGVSTSKQPDVNVHAGKYKPVESAYLENANFPGYGVLPWYLLGSPEDVPVIETAFLNGQQNPTVESADANFDELGVQMRGFFDFGVAKQDFRGGAKSKGQA